MQATQEGLKCSSVLYYLLNWDFFVTSGKDSNNTWMIIAIVSATLFAVVVVAIGMTLCVCVYKRKMNTSQMDLPVPHTSQEELKPLKT